VLWREKSIGDILSMSIDDAVEFFQAHPKIHHCLKLLQDVGLGYLTLGQQSPTLSGGEAQRIKLVAELSKVRKRCACRSTAGSPSSTLYVLDEPTVGLHMADVEKLIHVLHRLVGAGNTAVVVSTTSTSWLRPTGSSIWVPRRVRRGRDRRSGSAGSDCPQKEGVAHGTVAG